MRILLVNPMIALFGWNCWGTRGRETCSLPHGLLSIATVLKRHGHEVHIFDLRQHKSMYNLALFIRAIKPAVVGTGAMSVDFDVALEVLRTAKEIYPEITTVLGGVHVTIAPAKEFDLPYVDFAIRGEAEITLAKMVDSNFRDYRDIAFCMQGEIPDLDRLPFIDRNLVDYHLGELHAPYWAGKAPYVTMMAGRGCPYLCSFCHPVSMKVFRKVRRRSPANVIAEMISCSAEYGAEYFDFMDDTFTLDPEWISQFCEYYRWSQTDKPFVISSRADTIVKHPKMFRELREAGCDAVSVGFESGNDRILKLLKKGTTRRMNLKAARILRKNEFKIISNVMYGIPTETVEEARQTASMLEKIRPEVNSCAWFTIYPGCDLYDEYGELSLVKNYADMNRYPGKPKIKGVDYEAISEVMYA